MVYDNNKAILEALLFASEGPLAIEQIKNVLNHLEADEIRVLLGELKSEYDSSNRGIRIAELAGGFQMITPSALAPFLSKLYKQRHIERISRPALETLAIIAYKQPVAKKEIQALRDVNIDGVMKSLLDKNLIRVSGRKRAPGRAKVYGTTKQFLEHFGLGSLDELPKIDGVVTAEAMGERLDASSNSAQEALPQAQEVPALLAVKEERDGPRESTKED